MSTKTSQAIRWLQQVLDFSARYGQTVYERRTIALELLRLAVLARTVVDIVAISRLPVSLRPHPPSPP